MTGSTVAHAAVFLGDAEGRDFISRPSYFWVRGTATGTVASLQLLRPLALTPKPATPPTHPSASSRADSRACCLAFTAGQADALEHLACDAAI